MKNLFIILFSGTIFFSCSKTIHKNLSEESDSLKTQTRFVTDSVIVEDSLMLSKNIKAIFSKQLPVFPSIQNKEILDSIYSFADIPTQKYDRNSLKNVLTQQIKQDLQTTKKEAQNILPDYEQTWDKNFLMKAFSYNQDILTVQYSESGYAGGAHGYYTEKYKTFDLKNNTVISQNEIFKNPKDPIWNKILDEHFTNQDQREMLLAEKIELNNNFYFDNQKITFVYEQYEITAYAAGVVEISMNFNEIKNQLKPEFLEKYNIK